MHVGRKDRPERLGFWRQRRRPTT